MAAFVDTAVRVSRFVDMARSAEVRLRRFEVGDDRGCAMTKTTRETPASAMPTRIELPGRGRPAAKPKPRDELARPLTTMLELGTFVRDLRTGLSIHQAELAARAGLSRQWIVALEQGKPSLEASKVLRTLETLGFEIVVAPYDPPPPWMLRAVAAAQAKRRATAAARCKRRNTRRARAREARLAANSVRAPVDVE